MAKKVTFTPPEGYQFPEGVQKDSTFDESVTLKMEGDKICLVAINGVPMPGYEDEQEEGTKSSPDASVESDFAARYQQAMQAGAGTPQ